MNFTDFLMKPFTSAPDSTSSTSSTSSIPYASEDAYVPDESEQAQANMGEETDGYNPFTPPGTDANAANANRMFEPRTPSFGPPPSSPSIDFGSPDLNEFFETLPSKSKSSILALPQNEQAMLLRMIKEKKESKPAEPVMEQKSPDEILNIENKDDSELELGVASDEAGENNDSNASNNESSSSSSSSGTKKIIVT
jgi:hypothetical protein